MRRLNHPQRYSSDSMVAVCIVTYNQEQYIAQAIESVLTQQCDEPIRIFIGDDASTDKTEEICRRYVAQDERIFYYRREKNVGLVSNTIDLYRHIIATGCSYIAMLDGDDYWYTPDKLQSQINFLRQNPTYGFVHTAAYNLKKGVISIEVPYNAIPIGDVSYQYKRNGVGQTNSSVVFLTKLLREKDLDEILAQHFRVLDYPLYGLFAQYTYLGYMDIPTVVWRVHDSTSNPNSIIKYGIYLFHYMRCWRWLEKRYPGKYGYTFFRALYAWTLKVIYATWVRVKNLNTMN